MVEGYEFLQVSQYCARTETELLCTTLSTSVMTIPLTWQILPLAFPKIFQKYQPLQYGS